jgi:hypothetical protein
MYRVRVSIDGDAFARDLVKIYVKTSNRDGDQLLLPVEFPQGEITVHPGGIAYEPAPTLTIPTELAKALLSQLAWHFFGDNDDQQTGDLVRKIEKLTAELSRERIRFDKLLNGISNLSVMRDGSST